MGYTDQTHITSIDNVKSDDIKVLCAYAVGILLLMAALNAFATHILVTVRWKLGLGSFQEIVYISSQQNRGYIFLVSLMKAVFFVLISGLCLQLVGNYMTSLIISGICGCSDIYTCEAPTMCRSMNKDSVGPGNNGIIYAIYMVMIMPVVLPTGWFFSKKSAYSNMHYFAYIEMVTVGLNTLLLIGFMIAGFGGSPMLKNALEAYDPNFNVIPRAVPDPVPDIKTASVQE